MRNRNIVRNLNTDLKSITHWLLANKISLNSSKTELIIFRKKNKHIPKFKIKLNGIKLQPKNEIKYLGLIFDYHLSFEKHIQIMNAKLKRANNLLAISRHYLPPNLLKQIYYSQFHSHITYGCQLWGFKPNRISTTFILQKKAIRLISFANKDAHTDPLFKDLEILKLNDVITSNNILFVHKTLNGNSPNHFDNFFSKVQRQHNYNTSRNTRSIYSIPIGSVTLSSETNNTLKNKCIEDWNNALKILTNPELLQNEWLLNRKFLELKYITKKHFLSTYVN